MKTEKAVRRATGREREREIEIDLNLGVEAGFYP